MPTEPRRRVPVQFVPCDLCGSYQDETVGTMHDVVMETSEQEFRLARCRSCGLIYVSPRPRQQDMAVFYPASYAPFRRRGLSAIARSWLYRRSVVTLQSYLAAPRRVVDVGCGTGELLGAVRAAGNSSVLGIEPSHDAALIARSRNGLPIVEGTLESADLEAESVDAVLMSHVLEHLPSPVATMSEVTRVLKPGGTVIIWVPNAQSFAAHWFGRHWLGWDVPRHLYSFTPGTVNRLADKAGLRISEIYHERNGMEWSWGLRLWLRQRWPDSPITQMANRLHPFLAVACTPVATLAALLGRSGRIRVIARKPQR